MLTQCSKNEEWLKIMRILKSAHLDSDGMDTSDLLEVLHKKYGRAWQCLLKGWGFISYNIDFKSNR